MDSGGAAPPMPFETSICEFGTDDNPPTQERLQNSSCTVTFMQGSITAAAPWLEERVEKILAANPWLRGKLVTRGDSVKLLYDEADTKASFFRVCQPGEFPLSRRTKV